MATPLDYSRRVTLRIERVYAIILSAASDIRRNAATKGTCRRAQTSALYEFQFTSGVIIGRRSTVGVGRVDGGGTTTFVPSVSASASAGRNSFALRRKRMIVRRKVE